MPIALTDLLADVQEDVQQKNGRPTTAQYTTAVKSAVSTFSERAGNVKRFVLNVVSGTATYTLPADFFGIIRLDNLVDGGIYQEGGTGKLIPVGLTAGIETYTIVNRKITLHPTPSYTLDRSLWYRAGHVLNASDEYPDLTEEQANILLIKARANALRYLGNDVAGDGWKYSFGDVTIDKTGQPRSYRDIARDLDQQFELEVARHVGPVGGRATYTPGEVAGFGFDVNI